MSLFDDDAQPIQAVNYRANLKKATESLLGICKGLIADQRLNEQEVVFLDAWLRDNAIVLDRWPGNVIGERVNAVLADGVVTDEEAQDLAETLAEMAGIDLSQGVVSGLSNRTEAEQASGDIAFAGCSFCCTGKFIYGPRRKVEAAIAERGGEPRKNVTQDLDYLVIGGLASRDWAHTSHGRKIEAAIQNRDAGHPVVIIEEEHCPLK
ncbi:BRCT domain-containing protein [Arhodomonas sp. AD133]|uniref:BRCT domain-containing protein n=1 Tax=Arhodomonas sp. AD133 TaxID=3415009 RepID=UPI003EBAA54F